MGQAKSCLTLHPVSVSDQEKVLKEDMGLVYFPCL